MTLFVNMNPFTEDERHEAYQRAQRAAYSLAELAAKGQTQGAEEHSTMWAIVALALRRDGTA